MEDCERNSKRREEIAAVLGSQSIINSPKKMKIQIDLNLPSHQLLLHDDDEDHRMLSALSPDNKKISPVLTSSNSGGFLPGDIFSIESSLLAKDSLRVVDLEAKSFETESSTSSIDNKSRETTPSSEFKDEIMDSTAGKKSTGAGENLQAEKEEELKRREEIEKYFDEVEKKQQKLFTDKYNYDVVNDVPLDGRYEWVRLKP